MKKFWTYVFILFSFLLFLALIFPANIEMRLIAICFFLMAGLIYVMILIYPYVRKKGGGGEYQRLVAADKNSGRRFR